MSLTRAITGGLVGLATGGPFGAAVGAISGGLSGGGDQTSQSSSSSSTEQMQLRKWSTKEQEVVNLAMNRLGLANKQMTPEEREKIEGDIYDSIYGLASDAITSGYQGATAEQHALAARRGGSDTSKSKEDQLLGKARLGRELGLASQSAKLGAREAFLAESADRRMNASLSLNTLDSMYRQRALGSKIVRTGSSTGTVTQPDRFMSSAAKGLSAALGDSDSWINNSGLFGGGTKGVPDYSDWEMTTDVVGD